MREIISAAKLLQDFLEAQGWRFCFIGGLAAYRWGERRFTVDADVTLLTGFGDEESFAETLLKRFPSRIADAVTFALRNRVLLLRLDGDVAADIAFGGLPFEEGLVVRSSLHEYLEGIFLRTCSAEDLIILKSFASRPQDWVDIHGVLIRQHDRLDWNLILQELTPLTDLKEDDTIVPRLIALRDEVETRY